MNIEELPAGIRESEYLTKEDIQQVASCERFPTEKELFQMRPVPEVMHIVENYGHDFSLFEKQMQLLAQKELALNNEWFAFKLLMVVEYTRESLV
jgi:hypothetical protein